jgi:uncharacterized membrane protein SpoIIM required for sporulation
VQHGATQSADEMATDFTKLVDDLAYAKTFYPGSKVTQYVNALAAKIYLGIYRNRKEESNRLVHFWKYDAPLTFYKHRKMMLFAVIIFFLFFSIGFFSSVKDDGFVREVLGDGYVSETEENIRRGNPFGVYGRDNAFYMWIGIMLNNIFVSFVYFFKGIFLGLPSLFALGKESIRLGAFEYMFYAKDLGGQAVVTVLIHGMLELTAIIIACAAGVVMGTSYLFPGTIKRLEAFSIGTKDGVKMVISLIPVFMVAAFFEGFVTRYSMDMPLPLSLFILLLSTSFIIWYYIIYPFQLKKKQVVSSSEVALNV